MMRLSELMPMSLTQEQMFQSLWWNPDDNDPAVFWGAMESFMEWVQQHGQNAPLAVPQLGSCASPGRVWRLRAARHSQEEASPLGAQPPPRGLEPAASKAA